MENTNKLPKIGEKYDYFDNGVISESRHYYIIIKGIYTLNELPKELQEEIKEEQEECDWLYAPTTDYVLKAQFVDDNDITLWFIRDKKGGWYSIGFWGGKLDIEQKKKPS